MTCSTESGASSPRSSGSEVDDINTPFTEKSILFDDDDIDRVVHPPSGGQSILVVGGCGFIGSHTVWELIKSGFNVIVVDNLSNAFSTVIDTINAMATDHYQATPKLRPSLKMYKTDYRDEHAMTEILEAYDISTPFLLSPVDPKPTRTSSISGVIHFAAYKAVGESIKQPLRYYSNNVAGLINFCSLLGDYGVKNLVFSSSATVYGAIADIGIPLREEFCSQNTTAFVDDDGQERVIQSGCSGLTNPYGRTKWMCEAILNDLAHADPEWTITALRYFNPIGCDESGRLGEDPRNAATNLMPVILRVISGALPVLNIYGNDYCTPDGTAVRDYIHITDLARGHLAALKCRVGTGFRVYNLGSGRGYSVLDLVTAMEKVSKRNIPVQVVSRRGGDVGMCVAKATRAETELKWRTEKTLDDCCRDVWKFLERVESGGTSQSRE